jgi:hypothetical protein
MPPGIARLRSFHCVKTAEAERFELSIPFDMPPFQGGGINRYPTPPYDFYSTKQLTS